MAAVQPTADGGSDKGDGAGTALLVLLLLLGLGTVAVLAFNRKMERPTFLGEPAAPQRHPAGALAALAGAVAAVKAVGRRPVRDSDGLPGSPHREPPPTNGVLAPTDLKPPAAAESS